MNSNDLKLTLRFNAETKEFIGQVKAASGSVSSLGTHSDQTRKQLSSLAQDSAKTGAGFVSLKNQIYGAVAGFSALMAVNDAKDKLSEYQNIRTQITALVGGQQQWIETEQYLNQVATEHNKTLLDMAGNYSRLAVLQEAGLTTQKETRDLFEGMSNAQSQLGATSSQLEQSMYGLSQAISSPVVHAEELNQVVDPLPGLLNKLDKAAGLSAGGFRLMVNSGKVTSAFFKETLIKALADYQGAAARTADNITAQQAELTRSYQQMVVAYETPISDVFGTSISASTAVLKTFTDNAETVSTAIGATLFVAMGRGAAAVGILTAAKIKSIAATRQELQATVQKTQAELAATQAEIRHLETMQISNNQKFRAIGAETTLAAAQARREVMTETLTAAQTRLNVVMRSGSGLMSAFGGPVGIAMMAAGALSYFAISANDAQKDTKELKEEVDALLGRMNDLQASRIESAIEKQKDRVAELREEYLKIAQAPAPGQSLWQKLTESNSEMRERQISEAKATASNVTQIQTELSQAEKDLTALEAKLKQTKSTAPKSTSSSDASSTTNQDAVDAGKKMLVNLQRQAALYGETSELAKVKYEIEHGALKGINDDLKKQLLLQAQLLDQKKPQNTDISDFYAQTDDMESAWLKRLAMEAAIENKAVVEENYSYNERLDNLKSMHDKAVAAAQGNTDELAAIEAEYRYQQEIAESDHQARIKAIQDDIQKQKEEANKGYWERYLDSAEKSLSSFDDLASSTINSFSSGMGNAFESMIFDSENLGDAMFNLAEGMTRSMVNALGKMAAEWLAYQAVQLIVGKTGAMSRAQEMTTEAFATSQMAALNAYSSTAAIPVYGPVLAPGAATAALAATQPMAASVSTLAFSGIAHDGIDRVPANNEGTWLLKANEMVLNTQQADNFRWMVEMMQQMRHTMNAVSAGTAANSSSYSSGVVVNIHTMPGETATTTQSTNENGETQLDVYIEKAVDASLKAMYSDADNGGPISTRIRSSKS